MVKLVYGQLVMPVHYYNESIEQKAEYIKISIAWRFLNHEVNDPYFPLMRSNCLDGNYLGSKGRRKYQLAMPIAVLSISADFCNLSFGRKSTQLDNLHLYLTLTTYSNYQSGRQNVNPFIIHQERTVSPVPFKSHNRVIRVAKRTSCSAGLRMA